VLQACSLERDLQTLDHGDETEVGERGISLSGGQKQRISLARALYSPAAHLLLDDCLSAVDSHTARWIYDYCITGPLMQDRTCILVTHNVTLCIPMAKHVVVLDNGRVLIQGDPETVVDSGILGTDELLKSNAHSCPQSRLPSRVPSFDGPDSIPGAVNGAAVENKTQKASTEETKSEGSVDWHVYALYLAAMGPWWYWIIVVAALVLQQLGSVATTYWIRQWATKYSTSSGGAHATSASMMSAGYSGSCLASGSCPWALPMFAKPVTINSQNKGEVDLWFYLWGYALLSAVYILLSFIREITVFAGSLRASRTIHDTLLRNVMRAKSQFFDSTPLGRIMNRFSKDLEAVDQEVAPVALVCFYRASSIFIADSSHRE